MKYLFICLASFLSYSAFAQPKPSDTTKAPVVMPDTTQPKQLSVVLTIPQWQSIFQALVMSKNVSAFDATEITQSIQNQLSAQLAPKQPAPKAAPKK